MKPEEEILNEIKKFFYQIFKIKTNRRGYHFASYKK